MSMEHDANCSQTLLIYKRSRTFKDRQHNGKKKKDIKRSTQRYTEN